MGGIFFFLYVRSFFFFRGGGSLGGWTSPTANRYGYVEKEKKKETETVGPMYGTFRLACTNYLIHRRRKKKKKVGTQRVQKNNKRKRKKICVPESYAHSVRIFFFLSYVRSVCGILPTPELFDFVFDLFSNSLSPPLLCIYFSLTSFTVPPTPPLFFAVLLLLSMWLLVIVGHWKIYPFPCFVCAPLMKRREPSAYYGSSEKVFGTVVVGGTMRNRFIEGTTSIDP